MQQNQTYRCPNCQTELSEPRTLCPTCGMALQRAQPTATFTKIPLLDGILGVMTGVALNLTGIGTIGAVIAYIRLRQRYPYFCSGIVIGSAVVALLILGIFLICLGGISR